MTRTNPSKSSQENEKLKNRDKQLWAYVCTVLDNTATRFGFPLPDIRPIKKKWGGNYVGSCSKRNVLRIALRDCDGKLVEPYQLIDTIAHELAHLRSQKHGALWFHCHILVLTHLSNVGVYEDLRRIMKGKTT